MTGHYAQLAYALEAAVVSAIVTWAIAFRSFTRKLREHWQNGLEAGEARRNRTIEARMRQGWRLVMGDDNLPRWADYGRLGYLPPDQPAAPPDTAARPTGPRPGNPGAVVQGPSGAGGEGKTLPPPPAPAPAWLWQATPYEPRFDNLWRSSMPLPDGAGIVEIDPRGITIYPRGDDSAGMASGPGGPPRPIPCPAPELCLRGPAAHQWSAEGCELETEGWVDLSQADPPPEPETPLADLRAQAREASGLPADTGTFRLRADLEHEAWCERAGLEYKRIEWDD